MRNTFASRYAGTEAAEDGTGALGQFEYLFEHRGNRRGAAGNVEEFFQE